MALDHIPPEILEYIAYLVATNARLGPPAHLIPLLVLSRRINSTLSSSSNPHLYASIFEAKFDIGLAKKRFGDALTPVVLTRELIRRMVFLKNMRAMSNSLDDSASWAVEDVDDALLNAYLLMLEDQGKNRDQLGQYVQISAWLRHFLFHEDGASSAVKFLQNGNWPPNTPQAALGMWLFWFFLRPDEYPTTSDAIEEPINVLKIQALGAHKYPVSETPWTAYHATEAPSSAREITWYSQSLTFVPPPLAIPAILSFLALTNRRRSLPLPPSDPTIPLNTSRDEWSPDWARAFSLGDPLEQTNVGQCFTLGSFEGVWEGYFCYTEFTIYGFVLRGEPPNILQRGLVGRHQQTWKLREHYLLDLDDDGDGNPTFTITPLSSGNSLRSYIPTGTKLVEHRDGVTVEEPGRQEPLRYTRSSAISPENKGKVIDIIVTGEGHSAWGQFSLVGRIRPCDGFISLSKDYVDGDRGKWLYRGYLAGNAYGNFVGRWRDTLTDSSHSGYEGCFAMSRRR